MSRLRKKEYSFYWLALWSAIIVYAFIFIKVFIENSTYNIVLFIISLLSWLLFLYLSYSKNQASVTIASFVVFVLYSTAQGLSMGSLDGASLLSYTTSILSISLILIILFDKLKPLKAITISIVLYLILSFIPILFISYYISFSSPLTNDELFAMFQTNNNETVEYISASISYSSILFFILMILVGVIIYIWHKNSNTIEIRSRYLYSMLGIFVLITLINIENLKLPKFVFLGASSYYTQIEEFKKLLKKRMLIDVSASKENNGETYVVVIGESLNKNHMSLYGYPRQTTPKLNELYKNGEILKFDNIYSNHVHTMQVMSLAFTEASQDNNKEYFNSANIVEIFKSADFETYWITNQSLVGIWDNQVSIIAQQSDKVYALNSSMGTITKTQNYDEAVLPVLETILESRSDKNRVIFIHLMGNHFVYCNRFPSKYTKFNQDLSMEVFGYNISNKIKLKDNINCYDNSVLYNDFIVSNIINKLKSHQGISSMVYFSDHGEDVFENLRHESSMFTYDMTQIPLLIWLSPSYQKKYISTIDNLKQNQNKLFCNDKIYDTLIGLSNIKTDFYQKEFDLSSSQYKVDKENLSLLHNKKKYNSYDNHYFWQKENFQFLQEEALLNKFLPHRVNSIAKLYEIWELGFRSFELNLVFDDKNDGKFYVGHHKGVIGSDLESYLNSIEFNNIDKIWLDVKNLNSTNYKNIFDELNRLDKVYGIKSKAILESSWKEEKFEIFSLDGWYTSYYLPTEQIKALLDAKDQELIIQLAQNISKQIALQKVKAISFDNINYDFVNLFLGLYIPNNVDFHSWYGPSLYSNNFKKEILEYPFYNDKRIKTLLCSFKSNYEL